MDRARARQAIADYLGTDVAEIVDQAAFRNLGADSLDLIELTMFLEQEFDVHIPDDEAFECVHVGDALDILARAVGMGDGLAAQAA